MDNLISKQDSNSVRFEIAVFWAMILIVIAGLYFRFKGLGKWPFTNDEYYLAQSVRYILDTGLPKFACGGYYTRGILYQYLTVPFVALGFEEEIVFRLVPVLSHIIALPGLYFLARKVIGKIGACVMVSIFSLSIIEVEFSRFARMYLPFQALFIWYLYFLYKFMLENDTKSFRWMIVLSFLSPFVFEGGIFLALLNFLPFVAETKRFSTKRFLGSICVFLFVYFYLTFDFRHFPLGYKAAWPDDLSRPFGGGGRFKLPYLLILSVLDKPFWIPPLLVVLTLSVWGAYQLFRQKQLGMLTRLSLVICLALSIGNLFGLLIIALAVLLLLDMIKVEHLTKRLLMVFGLPVAINFSFFSLYGVMNLGAYGPLTVENQQAIDSLVATIFSKLPAADHFPAQMANLFIVLFYYPTGMPGVFYAWAKVYPLLTVLFTLLILYGMTDTILNQHRKANPYRLIASIFLLLLTAVGVLNIDKGTRYTFFLYPVFNLLAIGGVVMLVSRVRILQSSVKEKIAAIIIVITVFGLSNDFRLGHLVYIDSSKYTFKSDFTAPYRAHYIMRRDYRGAAEFVEKNSSPDDLVISTHQEVYYYTDKIAYILLGHRNRLFGDYTACKGTKDRWTNANLIYRTENLFEMVDSAKSDIWIILNIAYPRYDESEVIEKYKDMLVFTAEDHMLGVYKIESNSMASQRHLPVMNESEHSIVEDASTIRGVIK